MAVSKPNKTQTTITRKSFPGDSAYRQVYGSTREYYEDGNPKPISTRGRRCSKRYMSGHK